MRDNRVRVLAISPGGLSSLLAAGEHPPHRIVEDAVPGDAEIIGCEHNWHGIVRFYIWSATFEVVPEGAEPPYLTPVSQYIERWPTDQYISSTEAELDKINAAKVTSHAPAL